GVHAPLIIEKPPGIENEALMRDGDQPPTDPGTDAQFFLKLACERDRGALRSLNLAPGKFPQARMRLALRTLREEDAAAIVTDHASDNLDRRCHRGNLVEVK